MIFPVSWKHDLVRSTTYSYSTSRTNAPYIEDNSQLLLRLNLNGAHENNGEFPKVGRCG